MYIASPNIIFFIDDDKLTFRFCKKCRLVAIACYFFGIEARDEVEYVEIF